MCSVAKTSSSRLRIAWIAVEPQPYHLALFEYLRRQPEFDLHCFFCRVPAEAAVPEAYPRLAEPESAGLGRKGAAWPRILRAIATQPWNAVVVAGYGRAAMLAAMTICLARRIPFLIHSDTHLLRPRGRLKRAAKRALLFPLLRQCAAALGLGRLQCEYWRAVGIPPDRTFIVGLVAHLDRFRRGPASQADRIATRRTHGLPETGLLGIYVGRLVPEKGIDLLLAGLARTPEQLRPHLLVVGNGPLRPSLERFASQERLPAHFLGAVNHDGVAPLYAAADFFVLPSRDEPWGIVVAEAMAAGLPVVLSDQVGAAYDLLQEGVNGIMVRGQSADCWSDALARCIALRDDLCAMGARSREVISSWTAQNSAAQFAAAVAAAIDRGRS